MKKLLMFVCLGALAVSVSACGLPIRYTRVIGNGEVVSETRHVSGFDSVELSGVGRLIIEQGEQESLEIIAEENLIRYLYSDVRGSHLHLGVEEFVSLQPTTGIVYRLTVKDLRSIEASGLGDVEMQGLQTEELGLQISGSGKTLLNDLSADWLTVEISGLGGVSITGESEDQRVRLSGAGNYEAQELVSLTAHVEISGSGKAVIWVTDHLDVEVSGAGSVQYYGSPHINSEVSGVGDIQSLGEK